MRLYPNACWAKLGVISLRALVRAKPAIPQVKACKMGRRGLADWRAGGRKSACPVRRKGEQKTALPTPIQILANHSRRQS